MIYGYFFILTLLFYLIMIKTLFQTYISILHDSNKIKPWYVIMEYSAPILDFWHTHKMEQAWKAKHHNSCFISVISYKDSIAPVNLFEKITSGNQSQPETRTRDLLYKYVMKWCLPSLLCMWSNILISLLNR